MKKTNIIDDISNALNLNYISDIKVKSNYKDIYHFLCLTKREEYPEKQWIDFARYFDIKLNETDTIDDVYNIILKYFKG